jgi:hypothetical protein
MMYFPAKAVLTIYFGQEEEIYQRLPFSAFALAYPLHQQENIFYMSLFLSNFTLFLRND